MANEKKNALGKNFRRKSSLAKAAAKNTHRRDITADYVVSSTPMCSKEKQPTIGILPSDFLSPIMKDSSDQHSEKSYVSDDDTLFNIRPKDENVANIPKVDATYTEQATPRSSRVKVLSKKTDVSKDEKVALKRKNTLIVAMPFTKKSPAGEKGPKVKLKTVQVLSQMQLKADVKNNPSKLISNNKTTKTWKRTSPVKGKKTNPQNRILASPSSSKSPDALNNYKASPGNSPLKQPNNKAEKKTVQSKSVKRKPSEDVEKISIQQGIKNTNDIVPKTSKRKKLSQSNDKDDSYVDGSFLLEDCIPKAKRKSNMRKLLAKVETDTSTQGERKSSRTRTGPIKFWEQRLNYVYKNGISTIDSENPVKDKIGVLAVDQKPSTKLESKIPIHKLSLLPRKNNSIGAQDGATKISQTKKAKLIEKKLVKNSPVKAAVKKDVPDAVEEAQSTSEELPSIIMELSSLKTELQDLASKMYCGNANVSSEGCFRIKPGKQRRILACTSKSFYTVLRGYVKIFVDDVEQLESKVSIKQGQTIQIFNCGKKEDCIIYFAEIQKGG